jgi:hypothetical protein
LFSVEGSISPLVLVRDVQGELKISRAVVDSPLESPSFVIDDGNQAIWAVPITGGGVWIFSRDEWVATGTLQLPGDFWGQPRGRVDFDRDRPPAQVLGISIRPHGDIAVFAAVPDPTWNPGDRPEPRSLFDTAIFTLDRASGSISLLGTFDGFCNPVGGSLYQVACLTASGLGVDMYRWRGVDE